jgi:hypothetical protein
MVPYLSLYPSFSTMKPLLCLSKKFIESRTIPVLFSLQGGFWFRPARNWQKQIVIPAEAGIQKWYT